MTATPPSPAAATAPPQAPSALSAVRLLDAGDCALTIEFGSVIAPDLVARVAAAEQALDAARARGDLPGVVETVPTFRSLAVLYDPLVTSRAQLDPLLLDLLARPQPPADHAVRQWRLPVCYGGDFGADLADVAAAKGLHPDDVVRLHSSTTYTVCMLGFLPGLPFMAGGPAALALPRRREPRVRVPAGSVAITGQLSVIYPWESPGGWHLLGRCPVPLFDAGAASPVLLAPGDRVSFAQVDAGRHAEIAAALRAGALGPETFLDGDGA